MVICGQKGCVVVKRWILDNIWLLIAPLKLLLLVLIIWLAVKFDWSEPAYDDDGNPNIEVHQQYGGR